MADPSGQDIERDDLQGNILQSYNLSHAAYLLVRFSDRGRARRWLREQIAQVTRATPWAEKPRSTLNLAFTWVGLEALGLPEQELRSFPADFREGMAARAAMLGDVGPNAPRHWQEGFEDAAVHAAVILHAQGESALEARCAAVLRSIEDTGGGVELALEQRAATLDGKREHFGYVDAPSEPMIRGAAPRRERAAPCLSPGDVILGYPDSHGVVAARPESEEIRRNGTYLVLRKLEQDVPAFRRFLRDHAAVVGGDPELLAAKLMGRWRSGAPLALAPHRDDPSLAHENRFGYADDPAGERCPLHAHIRRANPRDAVHPAERAAVAARQIPRRGLPYGPPLPEGEARADGRERGLLFAALCASISTQFEVIQREWLGGGNFCGALSSVRDPIAGGGCADEASATFTPGAPGAPGDGARTIFGVPRFVTVRGGGYFFVPGIRALARLAAPVAEAAVPGAPASPAEILARYDAIGRVVPITSRPGAVAQAQGEMARGWLDPVANAGILRELRARRPVFETPIGVLVSRFDDARAVLSHEDLSVREYDERMAATTGQFLLGLDATDRYAREVGVVRRVVRRDDLPRVRDAARDFTRTLLAAEARAGARAPAREIAAGVMMRLADSYFGVPGSTNELLDWFMAISNYIFPPVVQPEKADEAQRLGVEVQAYLDRLITGRMGEIERGAPRRDDVLGRLLTLRGEPGVDRAFIRRTLGGIVSGALVPMVGLFHGAYARLTALEGRPRAAVRAAAERGDTALLTRYLWEAGRLAPFPPVLFRVAARDTVIAEGTPRALRVAAGTRVIAVLAAALGDPKAIPDPEVLRPDRPDSVYLFLGHGQHECLGRFMAGPVLAEIAAPLLREPELREP